MAGNWSFPLAFLIQKRAMGSPKKSPKPETPGGTPDLEPAPLVSQSEARQLGRWVRLTFTGSDEPELYRIEFRCNAASTSYYWQRGDPENPMTAKKLPPALSYAFLGYLAASLRTPPEHFDFRGAQKRSPAASLGDAISQNSHRLHKLLAEQVGVDSTTRVGQIFGGTNVDGKNNAEREISIRRTFLPPDCIEVVWYLHGKAPLENPRHIEGLLRRIAKSLGIPNQLATPVGEGDFEDEPEPPPPPVAKPAPPGQQSFQRRASIPKTATELVGAPPSESAPPPPEPVQPPPAEPFKLGKWLADEFGQALKSLREQPRKDLPLKTRRKPSGRLRKRLRRRLT